MADPVSPTHRATFKLRRETVAGLRRLAVLRGQTATEVVESAIERELNEFENSSKTGPPPY